MRLEFSTFRAAKRVEKSENARFSLQIREDLKIVENPVSNEPEKLIIQNSSTSYVGVTINSPFCISG